MAIGVVGCRLDHCHVTLNRLAVNLMEASQNQIAFHILSIMCVLQISTDSANGF